MKYLIKNGTLLIWDGFNFSLECKDLFINGSTIEAIGNNKEANTNTYTVINAEHQLILPGLINTHTHAYMNLMKNFANNLPFEAWLFKRIIPIESQLIKSDFYSATMLGCIEMIRSGTTAFLDMHICEDECAKAVNDCKMRAYMGKCIRGNDLYNDADSDFQKVLDDKNKYDSELIKTVLSPHSIYNCSPLMLYQIAIESEKHNMLKHIHLSESKKEVENCFTKHGKSPVKHLYDLGFLDNKTMAAHCVKISDEDIDLLSKTNVNVITNPSSNAKLGNGIAPVCQMLNKKINLCLGTDSAASNNTLNLFREMNFLNLIHNANNESATALLTDDIIKSVSINPAKALEAEGKLGVIAEGAYADLIFIDLRSLPFFPNHDIISALCCSANGSEVDSVMVNGKFIMKNRELTTIDEEKIYFEISRIVGKHFN